MKGIDDVLRSKLAQYNVTTQVVFHARVATTERDYSCQFLIGQYKQFHQLLLESSNESCTNSMSRMTYRPIHP
jgi:hypothetical protein